VGVSNYRLQAVRLDASGDNVQALRLALIFLVVLFLDPSGRLTHVHIKIIYIYIYIYAAVLYLSDTFVLCLRFTPLHIHALVLHFLFL
jgi:hypothetical protein